MIPEELIPSIELCKRARKLGFTESVCFRYSTQFLTPKIELANGYMHPLMHCPAPTLQEILKELRKFVNVYTDDLYLRFDINDLYAIRLEKGTSQSSGIEYLYLRKNPAEAALELWCKLKENT